ncbi:MAG TPA: 6-pyruvoyl-tetrahydropterin synthase-related protein [Candidatus Aquilonibacter sp.]|nr:6-pyruvoyl-tetrahydropterin synthase-related protein [Candidatus Aquilonibacter sp.]
MAQLAPDRAPSAQSSALSWRNRTLLSLMAVATLAVSPAFFLGNASGHDFQFHVASWMEAARQWREGIFFPRWAECANWGFGEPRFIFYPPSSWTIGAALGLVLPWRVVPGAFIWLALIAAGMSMWKLAREWLDGPQAAVAAVLYAVNPYQLVLIYYRSDFAELVAITLFPLLFWGAVRISRGEWRQAPLLAAAFAGVWLSNAPAGVIATYSLALALAVGCVVRRSARPLIPGAAAMAGGFGLAAFYIVPAAWEQRWVQITLVIADHFLPVQNFLFTRSNAPDFTQFNWRVSWAALGAIVVTTVATLAAARRRREAPEVWWIAAAIGAAALFLMTPLSTLVWRYLPRLQFLQFPWRWLDAFGVAYALFVAAAMGRPQKRRAWLVPALILAATVGEAALIIRTGWWEPDDVPDVADAIQTGHGYEGTDEYMPIGGDRYQLPGNPDDETRPDGVPAEPAPPIAMADPDSELGADSIVAVKGARLHVQRWTAEQRFFTVDATEPMRLAPRLLAYPAWQVKVDGNVQPYESVPETMQMVIPVPAGNHRIEIRFLRTSDRTLGGAISLATAAVLLAFSRKRRTIKSGAED